MNMSHHAAASASATRQAQSHTQRKQRRIGLRTRILVPLTILMLLSIVGSTLGFLFISNSNAQQLLDQQLTDDSRRLVESIEQSLADSREGMTKPQEDPVLLQALTDDAASGSISSVEIVPGQEGSPEYSIADRVQRLQNRYNIDHMIVQRVSDDATRYNNGNSTIAAMTIRAPELLPSCADAAGSVSEQVVTFADTPLLIMCTPIYTDGATSGTPFSYAYGIIDLTERVNTLSREIELASDVTLREAEAPPVEAQSGEELRRDTVTVAGSPLTLDFSLSRQGIDELVSTGLLFTIASSSIIFVFVLLLGFWLARQLTLPVLHLADVASAVAEGDLSQRATVKSSDEIGVLGDAFNKATEEISGLLDEQARTAAERQIILESIADGVLAVDLDEHIVAMNPAAATLLHQPDNDALDDKPLSAMQAGNDPVLVVGLQQVVAQLRETLASQNATPATEQVTLGKRTVQVRSTVTRQDDGTVTGAVMVLQDVTQMVEADRAKSAFIATASHELRTPLTSLRGFVDMLAMTGNDNLNDLQRMSIDTIKRQTEQMTALVNDLLEMARLEQGKQRVQARWVNPQMALEEAVAAVHVIRDKRQVTVDLQARDDLPSVWIDPLHLRSILTNLISNGIKYSYAGSGKVVITAHEIEHEADLPSPPQKDMAWNHASPRSLLFTFSDNGVGIRDEDQPYVFERFYRSENPLTVEVGGTGLGLAITYALTELHTGQLGLRSVEGEGSTFWLRLPLPDTMPVIDEVTGEETLVPVSVS